MQVNKGMVTIIHETDLQNQEKIVIGVATDRIQALLLINEYYGDEAVIENFRDVRDSNIDFKCTIYVDGRRYRIVGEDFEINKI